MLGSLLLITACGDGACAAIVTFNGLPDGTSVTSQFQSLGILFVSGGGFVYASDFGDSFPDNVILGSRPGVVSDDELVEVIFVDPLNPANPGLCNSLSVAFEDLQLAGNGMYAYDADNNFLGSVLSTRLVDNLGSKITEIITISFPGMHRVVLDGAGGRGQGDIAFDDFNFGAVTAVPEPSIPLLGAGLTLAGFWNRRRVPRS